MLNTETIQWRSTDEKPTSEYILVKFKGGNVEMVKYADNLVEGSKIVLGNFGWAGGSDYCGMSSVEKWALLPNGMEIDIYFKRPIMDSALSSINQVTDKERLLEAFLQWFLNQQGLDERGYDVKDSVSDYLSLYL